jgi:hypothetical protein
MMLNKLYRILLNQVKEQLKQFIVVFVIHIFVKVQVYDFKVQQLFVLIQHLNNLLNHQNLLEVIKILFENSIFKKILFLAKFVCPNSTCHRELGGVILLSRNIPAYALQITALKFFMNGEKEPHLFKKWSLYQGHMEAL